MASRFVSDARGRILDCAQEPQKMLMPIVGFQEQPLVSLELAVEPLLSILSEIETYVHVSKTRCKNLSPSGLTLDESASIMLYTMDWEPHDECLYVVLNATLRSENRGKLKPWFLYLKLIITALSKIPSARCTLYRGIKEDLSKLYTTGSTFIWWAFSSCTKSINVLESNQFLGKNGARTLFSIECESGKDIRDYGYFPKEDEVLLLPARQFRVVSCLNSGNGLYIIQVKEIEPQHPLLSVECKTKMSSSAQSGYEGTADRPTASTASNAQLQPPGKHIMVLYEPNDQAMAEVVTDELLNTGYEVRTCGDAGGHQIAADVSEDIEGAWAVICFLTRAYQASDEGREQLRFAKNHKKPIVPIIVEPNWTPSGWLDYSIADIQRLKWDSVQPSGVPQKMPELLLRLRTLHTGKKPDQNQIRAVRRPAARPERN